MRQDRSFADFRCILYIYTSAAHVTVVLYEALPVIIFEAHTFPQLCPTVNKNSPGPSNGVARINAL